jgi:hypothetical protein
MLRTQNFHIKRQKEEATKITHFSPEGLIPIGQTFVINFETRTISLLSHGPTLIVEQQLSANEMRLLVPILEFYPHYCPYEVLLTHITTNTITATSISRSRQRLQQAQACGQWQQELRPVRRALSSLRCKLHRLDLGISNVRERGCGLTSLADHAPELQQL